MATLLTDTTNIEQAIAAEKAAPAGLLEIRFWSPNPVGSERLQDIFDTLYNAGISVKSVYDQKSDGLWYVSVRYFKPAISQPIGIEPVKMFGALPLAVIPLIAFSMIVALIGIGVYKIEEITNNIAKLLLIVFGATVVVAALMRKPIETAATRYVERKF